jgi:hypothetical protein
MGHKDVWVHMRSRRRCSPTWLPNAAVQGVTRGYQNIIICDRGLLLSIWRPVIRAVTCNVDHKNAGLCVVACIVRDTSVCGRSQQGCLQCGEPPPAHPSPALTKQNQRSTHPGCPYTCACRFRSANVNSEPSRLPAGLRVGSPGAAMQDQCRTSCAVLPYSTDRAVLVHGIQSLCIASQHIIYKHCREQ